MNFSYSNIQIFPPEKSSKHNNHNPVTRENRRKKIKHICSTKATLSSYRFIMRFQLCLFVLFACVAALNALPLDLGNGGVYDNPEANAYWEKRFGRGFFSNLASIQKNINSLAKTQKTAMKVDAPSPIEPVVDIRTVVEEQVQNSIKDEPFMMVKAPEILTINPGPIFFEDVHF